MANLCENWTHLIIRKDLSSSPSFVVYFYLHLWGTTATPFANSYRSPLRSFSPQWEERVLPVDDVARVSTCISMHVLFHFKNLMPTTQSEELSKLPINGKRDLEDC